MNGRRDPSSLHILIVVIAAAQIRIRKQKKKQPRFPEVLQVTTTPPKHMEGREREQQKNRLSFFD